MNSKRDPARFLQNHGVPPPLPLCPFLKFYTEKLKRKALKYPGFGMRLCFPLYAVPNHTPGQGEAAGGCGADA
eukprot:1371598-Amorphochlora_amoeboformis.AAC.2